MSGRIGRVRTLQLHCCFCKKKFSRLSTADLDLADCCAQSSCRVREKREEKKKSLEKVETLFREPRKEDRDKVIRTTRTLTLIEAVNGCSAPTSVQAMRFAWHEQTIFTYA